MTVDSIRDGIVIDHIPCKCGMKLYDLLKLSDLNVPVAMMQNVTSRKMGRKDIIKIDADIDVNLDVIGYVAPEATVCFIKNGELSEKMSLKLPERLVDVVQCKNPRCITSTEQELPHIFKLTDPDKKIYRCIYCETQAK